MSLMKKNLNALHPIHLNLTQMNSLKDYIEAGTKEDITKNKESLTLNLSSGLFLSFSSLSSFTTNSL